MLPSSFWRFQRCTVEASGHRPPRGLSVRDATGITANAFRRAGCDMATVDRLPSEDPTMPHIMGDASDFLDAGFDFIIGQPPCILSSATREWSGCIETLTVSSICTEAPSSSNDY